MTTVLNELKIEDFINNIKEYPIIWNVGSEDYHARDKKRSAWNNICKIYSEGFEQKDENQKMKYNNSKSKILVRSHAMREEASPPREPTPTAQSSPCIKVIPSSSAIRNLSPVNPLVVLSPSLSRNNSPSRRTPICISPTTTLMPSSTPKLSPRNLSPHADNTHQSEFIELESGSPKLCGAQNFERKQDENVIYRGDIIVEETSQVNGNRRAKNDKVVCNCVNQDCGKCSKVQDRHYNNIINSNVNNNNNMNNNNNNHNNALNTSNMLSVKGNLRGKLRQQSSSQGSFDGSLCNSPCLSRDSSSEQYTDSTGVDLEQFIPETLNKNAKDRALMLRIEQELVNLAKDKNKTHYKFPPMSSYQRMLVHRCAAYFGMEHNIEPSGKCVLVNKTRNTRIPDVEFKQHIKDDIVFFEEPRRSILKRDSNSMEDYSFKSPDRQYSLENRRSKSIEEREEEYEKVRRRIFKNEMRGGSSTDDFCWSEVPWSSTESDNSSRLKLQLPHHIARSGGRLLKVQSEDTNEETMRPCVAKSYSFGGYGGVLTRGDSVLSTHSAGPRLFTKQDSAASSVSWRLSPSSSGYKTQSQRSESITPSPTSTPYLSGESVRHDSTNSVATNTGEHSPTYADDATNEAQIVWVVTDIHRAPKGSIIINPQTGQPVRNQDGSVYHYDPLNPPPCFASLNAHEKSPTPPLKDQSPQKIAKERPASPKKRSKSSPVKKSNVTNSSTSPSLPFTPPLQATRNFQFATSHENNAVLSQQQQMPLYSSSFTGGPPDSSLQVYQQPYVVYAPYSVPVQYENRLETQLSDVPGYYMNVSDTTNNPSSAYQTPPPVWNQQPMPYYQSPHPSNLAQQRFTLPLHGQPSGHFVSAPYATNYIQHPNPPNADVMPLFHQQSMQMMFPSQTTQQNSLMFPSNQNLIYGHNPPVYSHQIYPMPNTHMQYPQCTSSPNSCLPGPGFCGQIPDLSASSSINQSCYNQLAQSMNQLGISAGGSAGHLSQMGQNLKPMNVATSFDARGKPLSTKGNKFSNPKNYVMCSSQSSTETSSPAATVIAGYCQNQGGAFYRTPPETPPTHAYSTNNFMPPVVLRQMSNVQPSPPVTSRSSRSPTPASDVTLMERQRFSLPPTLYQGIPYVLQSDTRILSGRGQPNAYRLPLRQQNLTQTPDKGHKNRKPRGNKMPNMPPNGKQPNPNL